MSHDELAGSAKAPPVIDFAGLYRAHAGEVRRFALYLSADPSLADDIVSETFIRLWSARDRVVLPTVRAYLFAIARNLFLQQRQRAHRDVELDEQVADGQPDPEEQTRSRAELRTVMSALQALPEPDRAAVLMRADDGMSYDEIARALGISPVAARVKVHRARLKLAEARLAGAAAASGEELRP